MSTIKIEAAQRLTAEPTLKHMKDKLPVLKSMVKHWSDEQAHMVVNNVDQDSAEFIVTETGAAPLFLNTGLLLKSAMLLKKHGLTMQISGVGPGKVSIFFTNEM